MHMYSHTHANTTHGFHCSTSEKKGTISSNGWLAHLSARKRGAVALLVQLVLAPEHREGNYTRYVPWRSTLAEALACGYLAPARYMPEYSYLVPTSCTRMQEMTGSESSTRQPRPQRIHRVATKNSRRRQSISRGPICRWSTSHPKRPGPRHCTRGVSDLVSSQSAKGGRATSDAERSYFLLPSGRKKRAA